MESARGSRVRTFEPKNAFEIGVAEPDDSVARPDSRGEHAFRQCSRANSGAKRTAQGFAFERKRPAVVPHECREMGLS